MADADSAENRTSERTQHLMRIYRPKNDLKCFVDLGCGTGTISKEIALHYGVAAAIGVDLHAETEDDQSPEIIRVAFDAPAPPPLGDHQHQHQQQKLVQLPPPPPPPPLVVVKEVGREPIVSKWASGPPAPPPPMGLGFDEEEEPSPSHSVIGGGGSIGGGCGSSDAENRFAGMSNGFQQVTTGQGQYSHSLLATTPTVTRKSRCAVTYQYRQLVQNNNTPGSTPTTTTTTGGSGSFIIPCEDNSVDLLTCFMAIHHFEDFVAMMNEVKRVLSPNGVLFIREHDVSRGDNLLKKVLDNMHEAYSDHTNSGVINYWPRAELRDQMENVLGFKHVLDDDYPPGTPNPQKIYHSLYAKELTDLKYIPPSERKSKPAVAAAPSSSANAAGNSTGRGGAVFGGGAAFRARGADGYNNNVGASAGGGAGNNSFFGRGTSSSSDTAAGSSGIPPFGNSSGGGGDRFAAMGSASGAGGGFGQGGGRGGGAGDRWSFRQ